MPGAHRAVCAGATKLLEPVDGQPLLRRKPKRPWPTGAPVIVALPVAASARRAALGGLSVREVEVPDAALGMGHTLAAAAAMAPPGAVLVTLADMPEIGTAALMRMLEAHATAPGAVLRGAAPDGTPGHPVLFPARLRPDLLALSGDVGARGILRGQPVRLVTLPGQSALTDLDTPEDWAAWRARTQD